MNTNKETPPERHRARVAVSVDLPGILSLLLVGVFVLILITVGYGFWTGTLKPELVLAAGSTLFTGVLGGALAARRVASGDKGGETSGESPKGGDSP